jgi:hypothetical protein
MSSGNGTGSAVAPYTSCASCALTFTGQAWLELPLAWTLAPKAISEHVARWPATQSIEVRICSRCGRSIARKGRGA